MRLRYESWRLPRTFHKCFTGVSNGLTGVSSGPQRSLAVFRWFLGGFINKFSTYSLWPNRHPSHETPSVPVCLYKATSLHALPYLSHHTCWPTPLIPHWHPFPATIPLVNYPWRLWTASWNSSHTSTTNHWPSFGPTSLFLTYCPLTYYSCPHIALVIIVQNILPPISVITSQQITDTPPFASEPYLCIQSSYLHSTTPACRFLPTFTLSSLS